MTSRQADQAEREVGTLLSACRVRFTAARRQVVHALALATGPMAAGELHGRLRGRVPLSSLYRTLAVLEEARVLAKEHDAAGVARYELAESLVGHHHHLVCLACGEVREGGLDPPTEDTVVRLVEDIARRAGYRATGHRIDIEGTCASCRTV